MKDMRNIYVYKNHPHFCPRKNGDSCRPVSGFHRLKRDLHSRIVIPISPTSLLRPFPCSLRVSVSIVFLLIPWGSHAFPPLWFLSDAVFIVFPCPSLIVFSSFSIPLGAAFPRFICFPFVSRIAVARRGAMRCRFPPVPVSSPVSSLVSSYTVSYCVSFLPIAARSMLIKHASLPLSLIAYPPPTPYG